MKLIIIFQIFLLFLITPIKLHNTFKCTHDQEEENIEIKEISFPYHRSLSSTTNHSINIILDTEVIESQIGSTFNSTEITEDYIENITSSFETSINMLKSLLTVETSETLYFNSSSFTSNNVIYKDLIPNILNTYLTGDIVIVPIFSELSSSTIASASPMLIDSSTKRPIFGYVKLSSLYDFTEINAFEYLSMVLLHEITHILVFSKSLYSYYQTNDTVLTYEVINEINRTKISTSKVIEYAKKHFNCENITGIELENYGSSGSIGSHWESRIMLGDYMISTNYAEFVISDITMALFEDSGWYGVNIFGSDLILILILILNIILIM